MVDFDAHPERSTHKVRNFGEDLWRMCRDGTDGWASTSLDETGNATDQLRVMVGSARRVPRVTKIIEDILDHYSWTGALVFPCFTPPTRVC